MTIYTAVKPAALRATGARPAAVFSSSDQISVEMADLVNEVAKDICASHDWTALTKVASLAPNGEVARDLPSDYDRMTMGATIDDQITWFWGYMPFGSVNEWLRYQNGQLALVAPGGWIITAGQIHFYPVAAGTAQFPYISSHYARDTDGNPKADFSADTDEFILDERLLTLGLIWRWKAQKGLEYGEDLATYNQALSQRQTKDGGFKYLVTPRNTRWSNTYTNLGVYR